MTGGTTYKPGEIVVAPVAHSDLSGGKDRPVLILAVFGEDLLVSSLTSNLAPRLHTIPVSTTDLRFGTLDRPSLVKVHALSLIHYSLVRKRFARVNPELFDRVRDEFRALV